MLFVCLIVSVSPLLCMAGGLVAARSVKFLGKLEATLSDQETREGWWEELRDEIKNHAKTLCCDTIVGYSESCTVFGDICVLSAVGTAAVVKDLPHPSAEAEDIVMLDADAEDSGNENIVNATSSSSK